LPNGRAGSGDTRLSVTTTGRSRPVVLMANLAPALGDAVLPSQTAGTDAVSVSGPSSRKVYRDLVLLEAKASLAAIIMLFILSLLGLDLTSQQWGFVLLGTPFCVAAYMIPDLYLIIRHFRPIGVALSRLDHGEEPTRAEASAAVTRALNLPLLSFLRINIIHGPVATASILTSFEILNNFGAGFAVWQRLIFAGTALLFAAPTHAMIEFFRITDQMAGPIARLAPFYDNYILPEHQSRLVSIRLRSKLLYLSICIAGLPLVFFGVSTGFKVNHLLWTGGTG
jgi:adenylate cyclase